jgi:hypothetical protein
MARCGEFEDMKTDKKGVVVYILIWVRYGPTHGYKNNCYQPKVV